MTARRVLWALYWAVVLGAALSLAAALPFTSPAADAIGIVSAAGISFIGYACAPHPGGTR